MINNNYDFTSLIFFYTHHDDSILTGALLFPSIKLSYKISTSPVPGVPCPFFYTLFFFGELARRNSLLPFVLEELTTFPNQLLTFEGFEPRIWRASEWPTVFHVVLKNAANPKFASLADCARSRFFAPVLEELTTFPNQLLTFEGDLSRDFDVPRSGPQSFMLY